MPGEVCISTVGTVDTVVAVVEADVTRMVNLPSTVVAARVRRAVGICTYII